jgi:TolB-like protein/Tfp pilus assembly protein PilF
LETIGASKGGLLPEQHISAEHKTDLTLEIAHLLFIDVVGYSKLLVNEQIELMQELNRIVRGTECFREAEASGKLIRLPTGDGMVLLFFRSPEQPVRCALEISQALRSQTHIQLRMGVHSGPVNQVVDVNDQMNIAGAGINVGQRVMDCGDAGHILLSKHVADDLTTSPAALVPEKSIAVLPFENRSEDKANAYFADGIQDEILTRLSKIADLKVISRTSTQHYKSAPENLTEIARQLGVAHILEGSVQKSGNAVRVNVQLIKAANDSHLWADTFDRKLTDIFSVESEVAKAIADQLRAKLTGQEVQTIAAKPTDNVEAYDAYLRGLAYTLKAGNTPDNALGAQKYLKEAVRLDPKFALGWALLSYVDATGYIAQSLQPTVALREEARQAVETALTLQPNLGEAALAKGQYHYACLKDYDTAVRYFEQARQFLPNSSRIPESLAYVERRRGQWDRSESYFNEAERLDPRNVELLTQHALSYIHLRRFHQALRKCDQVLDITPDDVDTLALKASIAQAEGDLPRASEILAPLHPAAGESTALEIQVYQAILERRPGPIIPRLKEILAKPDPALGYLNGELRFYLGWAQEVASDHAAAQESWQQARSELESFLKEQPDNSYLIGDLALTNMGLADKAVALALSERAMAAVPIEKDALAGPGPIEILARVAACMGEPDRAIAALQKLLLIPYTGPLAQNVPLTPALLRLDPMFDPLRNDPRFEKLASSAPKAAEK